MTSLICGSLAFDTIMSFHGRFSEALLADQLHKINVAFLVPGIRREYGGCAGNIGYNLKLLGGEPLVMATVGQDGAPYLERLQKLGIDTRCIRSYDDAYTAQAFITTDSDNNQITAFHPGAMSFSHRNTVPTDRGIRLGLISPDGKDGMQQHAAQFAAAGIPFIFDPGQGMPMFDGAELLDLVDKATWVTLNDYEAQLMQERTGLSADELARRVEALVITRGANGSLIHTHGQVIEIPPARPHATLDPTGCGDAYRAGLVYGLLEKLDWPTTGRIASLMGAIKVETHGTQNHTLTLAAFKERYRENFGASF